MASPDGTPPANRLWAQAVDESAINHGFRAPLVALVQREAVRCLKRYLARRMYHHLTDITYQPALDKT